MLSIDERLKQQNGIDLWIDCNLRGRSHHWQFERTGEAGRYWRCKRCPVSTIHTREDSRGVACPPPPHLPHR